MLAIQITQQSGIKYRSVELTALRAQGKEAVGDFRAPWQNSDLGINGLAKVANALLRARLFQK